MKKIILLIFTFFISINICFAEERLEVSFESCVDGDTANVLLDGKKIKLRFLAIDTPETKHPTKGEEPFGKDASEYTCNSIKNAKKLEMEYDANSDKLDKYDRHLVWVWVDDFLLQDELIKQGLAEVAYLYGDYKYTGTLENHQAIAKVNKLGIWQDNIKENKTDVKNYLLIGFIVGLGIILLITGNLNKQKIKKIIKVIKKYGA